MGIQLENISFFTPVQFERLSNVKEALLEKVDDYFYFSGRKAVVIVGQKTSVDRVVELKEPSQSRVKKVVIGALKVASYLTIAMPLFMLGLKMVLRWNSEFHTVKVIAKTAPQPGDVFVLGDVHGEPKGVQEKIRGLLEEVHQTDKVQQKQTRRQRQPDTSSVDLKHVGKTIPRQYPPVSVVDTFIIRDGKIESVHGRIKVFSDKEIIEVCPLRDHKIVDSVPIRLVTSTGKAVIQQQATRGCTAGAVTMLIVDHGKDLDGRYLRGTNLGDDAGMKRAIEQAGLKALVKRVANNLSSLRKAIMKNGPAVVNVETSGSHVVVVDEISEKLDKVTLRDPYHGWAIVVSGKSFKKALSKFKTNTLVQIQTA